MMRHRSLATIVTLLLALTGVPAHAVQRGDVYRQAKAATVLIMAVNDAAHNVSLGSGFFVGADGLLLTNAHVIEDHSRLFVYERDQVVHSAPEVIAIDRDRDLAALRVRQAGVVSAALTPDIPTEGTEVMAVGYPRASDLLEVGFTLHSSIATGVVSGVVRHRSTEKGHDTPFIVVAGVMNSGSSGGPLVRTDSGEVAGMVVTAVPYLEPARDRKGNVIGSVKLRSGLSYSIPAPVIREWLTANRLLFEPRPVPFASDALQQSAVEQEAQSSFATGHLLHTMALALHKDPDLLSLAVTHYKAAAAVLPTLTSLYRNLGLAHAELRQWDEALQAYAKAMDQAPEDAALLTDAGLAWQRTGQWERAAGAYRAALRVNPRSGPAHIHLGTLLWENGRLDDAILEFRLALESEPASPLAAYNLGMALEAKGLREDAVHTWESFLRKAGPVSDPDGWVVKMRDSMTRLKPVPVAGHQPK